MHQSRRRRNHPPFFINSLSHGGETIPITTSTNRRSWSLCVDCRTINFSSHRSYRRQNKRNRSLLHQRQERCLISAQRCSSQNRERVRVYFIISHPEFISGSHLIPFCHSRATIVSARTIGHSWLIANKPLNRCASATKAKKNRESTSFQSPVCQLSPPYVV